MNNTSFEDLHVTQKYLGNRGLTSYIVLMNMFIPLSTDLYLPALPTMNNYFSSGATITNLTLSIFFLFYAAGILLWGPLSDKYGRRPIIMVGTIIYISSCICCALSTNIYFLILARAMQGVGAGGILSASTAIIKDCYSGKKRVTMLAVTQSISGLAPMLAPVMGAWILQFSNWRGTFWALVGIGSLNLILTILYRETLKEEEKYSGSIIGSMSRLLVVSKNTSFIVPTLIFAIGMLPFMGYIAISSYVYVDYFGLSAQSYSYYFAANALISITGPMLSVRFFSGFNKKYFAAACMTIAALGGCLIMAVGTLSPLIFMAGIMIMSLTSTILRPFSSNILFEQQQGDSGSMSSVLNTIFTLFGSAGMAIASFPWGNIVVGLGAIIAIFYGLSVAAWYVFLKSDIPCIGVKEKSRKIVAG